MNNLAKFGEYFLRIPSPVESCVTQVMRDFYTEPDSLTFMEELSNYLRMCLYPYYNYFLKYNDPNTNNRVFQGIFAKYMFQIVLRYKTYKQHFSHLEIDNTVTTTNTNNIGHSGFDTNNQMYAPSSEGSYITTKDNNVATHTDKLSFWTYYTNGIELIVKEFIKETIRELCLIYI